MVESNTARVSVLPVVGSELPAVFDGEGRLGCGRLECWPVVFLSGFGRNAAGFAGRARREKLFSSGHIPGRWTYGGGANSGTDRAFGSGKAPGRFMFVCWSLTSLCHSNGHIETMLAREMNPFTALTRIRSQFLRTQ